MESSCYALDQKMNFIIILVSLQLITINIYYFSLCFCLRFYIIIASLLCFMCLVMDFQDLNQINYIISKRTHWDCPRFSWKNEANGDKKMYQSVGFFLISHRGKFNNYKLNVNKKVGKCVIEMFSERIVPI